MSGILVPWMANGRSGFRQIYPLLLIAHPIAVVCSQLHSNLVYCDMYRPPPKLTNLICTLAIAPGKEGIRNTVPHSVSKKKTRYQYKWDLHLSLLLRPPSLHCYWSSPPTSARPSVQLVSAELPLCSKSCPTCKLQVLRGRNESRSCQIATQGVRIDEGLVLVCLDSAEGISNCNLCDRWRKKAVSPPFFCSRAYFYFSLWLKVFYV